MYCILKESKSIISCRLLNRVRKPIFTPKKRDSYILYKFISVIVILSPIALVVTNILIIINITGVLRWFITVLYIIYSIAAIRVVNTRRETVI